MRHGNQLAKSESAYIFKHARTWAVEQARCNSADANAYAAWYLREYPNGDKSHSEAFYYWKDNRRKCEDIATD